MIAADEAERERLRRLAAGSPGETAAPPLEPTINDQVGDAVYHGFFTLGTR
jgi:hypothetical protein